MPDPTQAAPINMDEIKQQLQLPATATPEDVVAAMLQVIAQLTTALQDSQGQYHTAVDQLATNDVAVANRLVEDFADVIGEDPVQKNYWAENFLLNRDSAVEALIGVRNARAAPAAAPGAPAAAAPAPAAPAPAAAPAQPAASTPAVEPASTAGRTPLRNRLVSEPRTLADVAGGGSGMAKDKAVLIRNRASAISRERGIPYNRAFDMARAELAK